MSIDPPHSSKSTWEAGQPSSSLVSWSLSVWQAGRVERYNVRLAPTSPEVPVDDREKIEPYRGVAGGWGALGASAKHLLREKAVRRGSKSLLRVNQPDGFDCPGCAWPEPQKTSRFEFCENGVKAVAAETTSKRVTPEFFAEHTVSELLEKTDHWLEVQGRLTHPMAYDAASDKYLPVSWEQVFQAIGKTLRELDSPDEAAFYTSGRTSNEAAFLYQLLGRAFGTNNFPDCSNMCHESSGSALGASIGIGKGTVQIDDFHRADCIFVIGQNPGTNHPRMLSELQAASKRGARIVAINPLKERGLERFVHPQKPLEMLTNKPTALSTLYVQPLVGGDLALLQGVIKALFELEEQRGGILDQAFIDEHTTGFEVFRDEIHRVEWATIEGAAGIPRETAVELAEIYATSDATIICWAMGLTQQKHSVPTIQALVALLLLRGNIGRPGAGACPVRGHSNVQGDRTVGITEKPSAEFLGRLGEEFEFSPPAGHGLDTVGTIEALHSGKAKVLFAMGGNFASATPDTQFTEEALRRSRLTAHVSTKLNRSHLVHGEEAFILPCLGRSELDEQAGVPQSVTVEDSMGVVHASTGTLEPASEHLLSEPRIVCELAKAVLEEGAAEVDWDAFAGDYSRVRDAIERVLPAFAGYNEKIREPGGFALHNSARHREWKTDSGRAEFRYAPIPDLELPEGQLRLMTLRSHDQYNTTIYGMDDRYRGVQGARRVLFVNEQDLRALGLRDGQLVDLHARWPGDSTPRIARAFRLVTYDIPTGCAASYFPETNVLVAIDRYADGSRTPMSKFVPIELQTSATGETA